ncbi:unnamed protein product [Sphagnum compactum]
MKIFAPSFGSWHGQFISKVVEAVSWMKDFFGCGSQKHNNGVLQGAISTNQFLYHIDDAQKLAHFLLCLLPELTKALKT